MRSRSERGADAERRVARYLRRAGYRILSRNWRCRTGELDLVVDRGPLLVFVEVRSVSTAFLESPTESVSAPKQARVGRAAEAWLQAHPRTIDGVRFDVVGVRWCRGRVSIDHIENAFCPAWVY